MLSRNRFALIGAGTVAAIGGAAYVACACTLGPPTTSFPCTPTAFDANNPAASGYQIVFQTNFQTVGTSTIDVNNTQVAGFQWYVRELFSNGALVPTDFSTDADGLILTPASEFHAMDTSFSLSRGTYWGGGAYFEASFAFDEAAATASVNNGFGWPAFWSMSMEHIDNNRCSIPANLYPGQTGCYENFHEPDFFEYDRPDIVSGNAWGSSLWEYVGIYTVTSCVGYSQPGAPSTPWCTLLNNGSPQQPNTNFLCAAAGCPNVNWSTFHTLGHLWVAGDANNGNNGYRQTFFDGQEARQFESPYISSKNSWNGNSFPPPASLPNSGKVWSKNDTQHFPMVFGSGRNLPFHIKFARVWQIPGCGTMTTAP